MPRQGPRPYQCVKRAWHTDRNQPIRGTIIQEIFRVASEIHSSATKKNKKWQDKLPSVVLRAEEIMYSKANSEAEYMDLRTLLDRANDAINTITRGDESTETRALLQPCIEASFDLGCMPRRALRSQRNNACAHTKVPFPFKNAPKGHPASNMCPINPLFSELRTEVDPRDNFDNPPIENDGDLSLRLGPLSVPCSLESRQIRDDEDFGLSKPWKQREFGDWSIEMHMDFPHFPGGNAGGDSSDSQTSKWSSGNEILNAGALIRKRKAILIHGTDDTQFCSQPKLPYKYHTGRIRNAGL